MARSYTKNATDAELAADLDDGVSTIDLVDTFVPPSYPFYVVVDPFSDSGREYVKITGLDSSGTGYDRYDCVRDLAGSESTNHGDGTLVRLPYTAQHLDDIWDILENAEIRELTFYIETPVTATAGVTRIYASEDRTILDARLMVGVADASASTTFDVHLDGTTIFTTQANRPTVAATEYVGDAEVPDVTAWDEDSYLTVDQDLATDATNALLLIRYTVD